MQGLRLVVHRALTNEERVGSNRNAGCGSILERLEKKLPRKRSTTPAGSNEISAVEKLLSRNGNGATISRKFRCSTSTRYSAGQHRSKTLYRSGRSAICSMVPLSIQSLGGTRLACIVFGLTHKEKGDIRRGSIQRLR